MNCVRDDKRRGAAPCIMRLGGLRANTVRPYGTTGVGVLRDGKGVPYRGW